MNLPIKKRYRERFHPYSSWGSPAILEDSTKNTASNTHISSLPNEMVANILGFLSQLDLNNAMSVSRQWYDSGNTLPNRRRFDFNACTPGNKHQYIKLLETHPNIHHISIGSVPDDFLELIGTLQPNVKSLKFGDQDFGRHKFWGVHWHPNHRCLWSFPSCVWLEDLKACYCKSLSLGCPIKHRLNNFSFCSYFSNLRKVNVSGVRNLSDQWASSLFQMCPKIDKLQLRLNQLKDLKKLPNWALQELFLELQRCSEEQDETNINIHELHLNVKKLKIIICPDIDECKERLNSVKLRGITFPEECHIVSCDEDYRQNFRILFEFLRGGNCKYLKSLTLENYSSPHLTQHIEGELRNFKNDFHNLEMLQVIPVNRKDDVPDIWN